MVGYEEGSGKQPFSPSPCLGKPVTLGAVGLQNFVWAYSNLTWHAIIGGPRCGETTGH